MKQNKNRIKLKKNKRALTICPQINISAPFYTPNKCIWAMRWDLIPEKKLNAIRAHTQNKKEMKNKWRREYKEINDQNILFNFAVVYMFDKTISQSVPIFASLCFHFVAHF